MLPFIRDSEIKLRPPFDKPLKLYTLYAGPDHVPGTVHPTHQDAIDDPNEH